MHLPGLRGIPSTWLLGTLGAIFAVQVAVTMARPVSTYRLLALDAGGTTVGLAAACFALPPVVLGVWAGRWTERRHPGLMLCVGLTLTTAASLGLMAADQIVLVALATAALGVGHMAGVIGGQSMMARAESDVRRLTRFGIFTTTAALGQVVGPVIAGAIIGGSADPSVESTSRAFLVAGCVVALGVLPAVLSLQAGLRPSTVRSGRPEGVWSLLRVRGMPAALSASFSAKGTVDLLLVYMPLLGVSLGLSPKAVGLLLGASSAGAMAARAGTPFLVRRTSVVGLTTTCTGIAAVCVLGLPMVESVPVLFILSGMLGLVLGLTQTTTLDWVVGLVDDTSRGSALGLRLATNRLGQSLVVALAGLVAGALGIASAFLTLGVLMLLTAAAGLRFRHRREQ